MTHWIPEFISLLCFVFCWSKDGLCDVFQKYVQSHERDDFVPELDESSVETVFIQLKNFCTFEYNRKVLEFEYAKMTIDQRCEFIILFQIAIFANMSELTSDLRRVHNLIHDELGAEDLWRSLNDFIYK